MLLELDSIPNKNQYKSKKVSKGIPVTGFGGP
jgi:hypothetical protein